MRLVVELSRRILTRGSAHMTRLLTLACLLSGCQQAVQEPPQATLPGDVAPLTAADLRLDSVAYIELLAAEDRRAAEDGDLDRIFDALGTDSAPLRRAAARALGRLERPGLVGRLLAHVDPAGGDPSPEVRAEVANAVAQAVRGGDAESRRAATDALLSALDEDASPVARAGLLRSVARIPPADVGQADRVADALAGALADEGAAPSASDATRLAAARAAYAHLRTTLRTFEGLDRSRLVSALDARLDADDPAVRRTVALARRTVPGPLDAAVLARLIDDADPGVRREGVAWAAGPTDDPFDTVAPTLEAGLGDPAPEVRIAAIQGWSSRAPLGRRCGPLLSAVQGSDALPDPGHAVALAAIGPLDERCSDGEAVNAALTAIVSELSSAPGEWHRPVRALPVLAQLAPEAATGALPEFVAHPNPFVRSAAATAAGILEAEATLRQLAFDDDANVRETAVVAWGEAAPIEVLVDQLDRPEPHLLRSTAARLAGRIDDPGVAGAPVSAIPRAAVAGALFEALTRASTPVEATMRDARVALLTRLGEVASIDEADRLAPYLTDPDPRIAELAASILHGWGVNDVEARPGRLPELPLPSFGELAALEDSAAVVTMANGSSFMVVPLPFEAPTNAARFFRMAREGVFDGLTWHRVVPNFVIQGGSPGADEYAGHGAYTRDEIGLVGHFAGTIGISTRGRDTGDGQVFVNLVDNLRLDHDYTVFGYLIEGLDAAGAVRPGERIERIRIVAR